MDSFLRFLKEDDHDHDHDDHAAEAGGASKVLTIKIVVMILVLISGCFVFFPYSRFVKNNNKKEGCCKDGMFFALMTSFAAGMLLAISLIHIVPEANAIYK